MQAKASRFLTLSCLVIAIAIVFPVSIKAQRQSLNLPARQIILKKLFREITKQTGLTVFYSDALIDDRETRRFREQTLTLSAALDSIVAGQPLQYEIKSDCILFSADPNKTIPHQELLGRKLDPSGNEHAVNGKIVDEQNIGLGGVTISVKGGKPVAISGGDGGFFIPRVTDADRLIFSAVTIDSFETAVAGKTSMFLTAKTKISQLQEVIVLNKGYYTESQKLSVGNTVKVTKEQMSTQSVTNPLSQLQGRVAGLMIAPNSGSAGTGFDVTIRGRNSLLNGTDPLYVIDGVPYISQLETFRNTTVASIDGSANLPSPLYFLNANDIISIDVQKDADACAIYGARGANGVILITTRKALAGKFHLNAQLSGGFGKVAHFTKLLNAEEYIAYRTEALANDQKAVGPLDFDLNGAWGDQPSPRNWDKLLRGNTAWLHNASVDISGGTDIFKYLCSGGYSNEGSITPGNFNNFKKFFHTSIEIGSANKKISLAYSADLITTDSRIPQNIAYQSHYYPFSPPLYDSGGGLNWQGNTFYNPYVSLEPHFRISAQNILNSFTSQYVLSRELTIKILAGINNIKLNDVDATPTTSYRPSLNILYGSSSFGFNTFASSNIEPQILYAQNFRKIKLSATVGYSYLRSVFNGYTQNGTGYTNNDLLETIAAATNVSNGQSTHTDYKYNAVFGRINVNWQDRFIINLTARRDGSSRFGNPNSFANFWSAAGGWIFVSGKDRSVVPGLTYGKIRASVGLTGNDQVGDYRFQRIYNYLNYQVPFQGTPGLYPAALVNKDLSWEKTSKSEIGLELSFMEERLTFAASYFSNRSGSQLVLTPLPNITGFTGIIANIDADISNHGLELTLGYKNNTASQLQWNSSFNLTMAKNRLKNFPGLAFSVYRNSFAIGQSINGTPAFKFLGVNPQTGLYSFLDASGQTTSSPDLNKDRISRVSLDPSFYGGLYNTLRYKQFELDLFIHFVKQLGANPMFLNQQAPGYFDAYNYLNWPAKILENRWQKTGDIASVQKFSTDGLAESRAYGSATLSDAAYTDASFIRFKSLAFSYLLGHRLCSKLHLEKVQFYLEAQNLFTITNYIGNDPETGGDITPPLRVFIGGIRISM